MTLQSPTATLIPLFSSSELTGCGYPGLLDRKNRSDMCPQWESNPRLPACKASTISTRPGSPHLVVSKLGLLAYTFIKFYSLTMFLRQRQVSKTQYPTEFLYYIRCFNHISGKMYKQGFSTSGSTCMNLARNTG